MSALHGPLPIKTLGQLRDAMAEISDLSDETPLVVSVDADEWKAMAPVGDSFPDIRLAALGIDAADCDRDENPVILFPVVP